MGIEFELKYKATEEVQRKLLKCAEDWQRISMETTYYDTRDHALSQRKYTLRRRLENGVSVCTVKTPVDEIGRGEWEVQAECIEAAIPELCKLGCPEDLGRLTASGVIPVCGARFVRQAATVTLGNMVAELALDTGKLFSGSRCQPLCEVELELKQGDRQQLVAYAGLLARQYNLIPEDRSKFRRALALWKEDEDGTTK